ncbi:tRNA (guanine-N(7)-)-methyltransferase subunit WDR4 [Echinococcus granulosus]|uniref:tRNA (Guanine-N(7)-)-methyltransferase subunit WDR4 n=1 Tax=Echinococcus granulosus TaxID=6210 RepID=W6URZ9_ECHGR|nr:tRNA (guanine-N(7)-)-methyltransferase subunit WDR4 [Echinococcus granulosus]EUB61132.1 tRNA (guanine-N(7)-)-methyltransferase subunit WDR4 [Echinococcus granulosus]
MLASRPEGSRILAAVGDAIACLDQKKLKKKVGCLTFTPDERSLLLGEKSGYVICVSIDGNNSGLFQIGGEDAFLGHLSLLTSVVLNKDGRLIGTCDRDEKIRIGRSSQPHVIESFCLGHTKLFFFVFYFFSDGFIRLWNALEGVELDEIELAPHLNKIQGCGTDNETQDFLTSRLIIIGCTAVLGVRSHDCVIAVKLSNDFSAFVRDDSNDAVISGVLCPKNERFVDCCVINHRITEKDFEVVCMTEPLSRFVSWTFAYCKDSALEWSQMKEWDALPSELKAENGQFPRLQLLMETGKSFVNMSGVAAYEKGKEETHKRIKERHQRHQAKRKRQKAAVEEKEEEEERGQEETPIS